MTMLSDWAENQALKYLLTSEALDTRPAAWRVSLHRGAPGENLDANEVTVQAAPADGYAPQPVTGTVGAEAATNTFTTDVGVSYTGLPSTDGTPIDHAGLWADSGGTWKPVGRCVLNTPKEIANDGDSASFDAGDLTFTLD